MFFKEPLTECFFYGKNLLNAFIFKSVYDALFSIWIVQIIV